MATTEPRAIGSSHEFLIRAMEPADLSAVSKLEAAVYPQPWSLSLFREELAATNRSYLVVTDRQDQLVAYGGLLLVETDAHITTLAVDPVVRRRRLGTRMMLALADRALDVAAQHLTLEVRMSNAGARALYNRFGFAPVGLRKNYYKNEDALVMWAIDIDTDEYRARLDRIRESLGVEDD